MQIVLPETLWIFHKVTEYELCSGSLAVSRRKIERKDVSERQHARAWDARLESWRFFDKFRGSAGNGEADERDSGGARWKSSNKPYANSSPIRGLGGLCHGPRGPLVCSCASRFRTGRDHIKAAVGRALSAIRPTVPSFVTPQPI
ncbi:hypothetical protein V1478_016023 [Vespula squamosa]|uniref:Uncharacterized protein n=1 Tax=Vespula squamosa TaxID=30214 RepID=A0ABD2A2L6_VESSQ